MILRRYEGGHHGEHSGEGSGDFCVNQELVDHGGSITGACTGTVTLQIDRQINL